MNKLFHSIKNQLILIFSIGLLFNIIITLSFFKNKNQTEKIDTKKKIINEITHSIKQTTNIEKDFLLYESINPDFFNSKQSIYIDEHDRLMIKIDAGIQKLKHFFEDEYDTELEAIYNKLHTRESYFDTLTRLTLEKGFQDFGIIGEFRAAVHLIEDTDFPYDRSQMLMLRRHEKDYLLRKQTSYISKLHKQAEVFRTEIESISHPSGDTLLQSLTLYVQLFDKVIELDKLIGYEPNQGLKAQLNSISKDIESSFTEIKDNAVKELDKQLNDAATVFTVLLIFGIILNLLLVFIVTKQLGLPIKNLSVQIQSSVKNNFRSAGKIEIHNSKNEIGTLSKDFNLMLQTVKRHTGEIMSQKEEIQAQADRLLQVNSEINLQKEVLESTLKGVEILVETGREITSHLKPKQILMSAYKSINRIMEADIVGVALYQPEKNRLKFRGIESNKLIIQSEFNLESADDLKTPAAICFNEQREILVNDADEEKFKYNFKYFSRGMDLALSCIYLPLTQKNIRFGVITVQSSKKNVYRATQVNLLRNIALYASAALSNAEIMKALEVKNEMLNKNKAEIEAQRDELQLQRDIVNHKNKEIVDSITYAEKIQTGILPSKKTLERILGNYFLIFKPKDIVSGDFYWIKDLGRYITIAVADCTGHGVPGAFMSMLGSAFLHELVSIRNAKIPGQILNELRAMIKKSLKQTKMEGNSKDGMDIGIITIVRETREMFYAGAYNSMFIVSKGKLTELKGNKQPIAIYYDEENFSNKEYQLHEGDKLYLFSDGYQDQFGGEKGKKFMHKKFRKLIADTSTISLDMQRRELVKTLNDWMICKGSTYEQVDDITILGIEI
jgi:serine phosphatase RsbU (regulator of sigma subunit)/HAMP domain-containing protein